ncbi:MAG: hypothetical protein ABIA67_03235 [Candidatus Margulisiibacteriota bacterium]
MRRLILLFLIVGLFFSAAAFGAEQWVDQTPAGFTDHLYGVHFASDVNGWAVGANGKVLKTTNGGKTWTSQVVGGAGYTWYGVSFVDATTGYIAGTTGAAPTIWKTINGDDWVQQTVSGAAIPADYRCINLSSATVGAAGGIRGASGQRNISYYITDLNNHVKAGDGAVADIHGINFFSTTGFAVGNYDAVDQGIYKSTDSGAIWTGQTNPTAGNEDLYDVKAISALVAWAVGDNGSIIKTTNGGTNWANQTSGTTEHLKGVDFLDATTGWAVGDSGTILKTDDGSTWATDATGDTTTDTLEAVHAFNQYNAWAVGGGSAVILKRRVDPTITTTSPDERPVGWSGDITLTGTNFLSDITVEVTKSSGTGFAFTFTRDSATQITIAAVISASASTGAWTITATNEDGGSTTTTFTVNTEPTLTSVKRHLPGLNQDVSWDCQGAISIITAEGTNFQSGATISLTGTITVSATTYLSSTKLQATMWIPTNETVGSKDATVLNPDQGTVTKTDAFEVRTNGTGPTITVTGFTSTAEGTNNDTKFTAVGPKVTVLLEDSTGLSENTVNFTIYIPIAPNGQSPDYYYTFTPGAPGYFTVVEETGGITTKAQVTAYLNVVKDFNTEVESGLDGVLTAGSPKALYLYAEDQNANPTSLLYDTVYCDYTTTSLGKKKQFITYPSYASKDNPQVTVQVETTAGEDLTGAKIIFHDSSGSQPANHSLNFRRVNSGSAASAVRAATGTEIQQATTTATDYYGHVLPNGIYRALILKDGEVKAAGTVTVFSSN